MSSLAELKQQGMELGYEGKDLADYVSNEQKYERDLRTEERAETRAEIGRARPGYRAPQN